MHKESIKIYKMRNKIILSSDGTNIKAQDFVKAFSLYRYYYTCISLSCLPSEVATG